MKRLATIAVVAALGLSGCGTTNNTFSYENGVCYRTRVHKTVGIQTSKDKVLAVPENCGVTTTVAP